MTHSTLYESESGSLYCYTPNLSEDSETTLFETNLSSKLAAWSWKDYISRDGLTELLSKKNINFCY